MEYFQSRDSGRVYGIDNFGRNKLEIVNGERCVIPVCEMPESVVHLNCTDEDVWKFAHWYCADYAKYAEDPARMLPFDQHLFLACIAPRALLVEGFCSKWFDPKGEYLAVKAASPVWELLCGMGLPEVGEPGDYETSAIGRHLGYVRRTEAHGISAYDWMWMMDFANAAWGGR